MPEIRHTMKPLWTAWLMTAIGAVCGAIYYLVKGIPEGLGWMLLMIAIIGMVALATVICYYIFGDSRRPFDKVAKKTLEPMSYYYARSAKQQLIDALNNGDEAAINAAKKTTSCELVLIRYSDKADTLHYSQLLDMDANGKLQPLTDIIVKR